MALRQLKADELPPRLIADDGGSGPFREPETAGRGRLLAREGWLGSGFGINQGILASIEGDRGNTDRQDESEPLHSPPPLQVGCGSICCAICGAIYNIPRKMDEDVKAWA